MKFVVYRALVYIKSQVKHTITNFGGVSLSIIDQYLDKEFSNNPKLDENIELKQVHGKITSALE